LIYKTQSFALGKRNFEG